MSDPVIPQEGWLLTFWDPDEDRWVLATDYPVPDRATITPRADWLRQRLGVHLVRLLHTADG